MPAAVTVKTRISFQRVGHEPIACARAQDGGFVATGTAREGICHLHRVSTAERVALKKSPDLNMPSRNLQE